MILIRIDRKLRTPDNFQTNSIPVISSDALVRAFRLLGWNRKDIGGGSVLVVQSRVDVRLTGVMSVVEATSWYTISYVIAPCIIRVVTVSTVATVRAGEQGSRRDSNRSQFGTLDADAVADCTGYRNSPARTTVA